VAIKDGAAGSPDLYKVTGRNAAPGTAADLNLGGAATDTAIGNVAVSGPAATANILISSSAVATNLKKFTGMPTPVAATVNKNPYIPAGTMAFVTWGGTTAFAGVGAINTIDTGVYRSIDSGATFDGVGLMNVGTIANMTLSTLSAVDDNTMFLVMSNATAGFAAKQVWKTADAGVSWVRLTSGAAIADVLVSPKYATDSTIVVIDGTTIALKSVNGGSSFTNFAIPTGALKGLMIDGTSFFVGGVTAGDLYKSGVFANATGLTGKTVFSIALNPKDATNATMAVGTKSGEVYQSTDGGVSFKIVGAAFAAGDVSAAYGPDGTLYGADSAAGVFRYDATAATPAWSAVQQAGASKGLVVTADGTLYMADGTAAATAVFRSLKPTAATAAKAEYQATGGLTGWAATYSAADLAVVATAAKNNVYVIENSVAGGGVGTFGYVNRIYGLSDTYIAPVVATSPADKALLTTQTTATIAWAAVTGATAYGYTIGTAAEVLPGNVTSVTVGSLTAGTTYTWSYRVTAPLFSRPSVNRTFITALPSVSEQGALIENLSPMNGAVGVAVDGTFSWTAVPGATGYYFVIAQETGQTDKFAIIDYSATTPTNAFKLRENLKFDTQYWWRVQPYNATTTGAWTVAFFTTMKEPVVVEPTTTTQAPPVIVTQVPPPEITIEIPARPAPVQVIPTYLLWIVLAIGAILVIAVIVLIVRTRRV